MKMLRDFGPFLMAATFVVLSAAHALAEGDVKAGEDLARKWCTRCHNVEPDGPFKLYPPSFASIAVYRSEDQIAGRIIYPPLHSNMPQIGYMLIPENVDDVVAYIVSLEKK